MSNRTAYNNAYNKANYIGVSFRLDKVNDMDVLQMLQMQSNSKAYICKLVRTDIKRQKARHKRIMNNGDRKLHADYKSYPFEVIEDLPFNDRYIVGFAEDLENAVLLRDAYAQRENGTNGHLHIMQRGYDPDLNTIYAFEVNS